MAKRRGATPEEVLTLIQDLQTQTDDPGTIHNQVCRPTKPRQDIRPVRRPAAPNPELLRDRAFHAARARHGRIPTENEVMEFMK